MEESNQKSIHCSLCGKGRHEVEQIIEGPRLNGEEIYICNECIDIAYETLHPVETVGKSVSKKKEKLLTPEEIKDYLDKHIVGQDSAKIAISVAVYNHYKRINNPSSVEIDKSNLLMVGSSGSGKTLTVKTIAKLFDVPFVIADATTLTEAGYVGADVDSMIKRLVQNAGGDIELAQRGIVFIDEIDKKGRKSESATVGRDVSGEGVQQSLLKLIEGTVITIEDEYDEPIEFDTSNVLFISSGAFVGLDEVVRKNRSQSNMGIGATLPQKLPFSQTIKSVKPDDFIKYGLIPEFVGRHPVTVIFDDLDVDMIVRILKEPENSLVKQFQTLFKFEGVSLSFDDKYLQKVAEECLQQKVGARGLRSILERDLQSTQFYLPSLAKSGVNKIFVAEDGSVKQIFKVKKRVNDE